MPKIHNKVLTEVREEEVFSDIYYVPYDVEIIGSNCFSENNNVRKIILPDSVKTIGDNSFFSCDELTDIFIPDSVNKLGTGAFDNCRKLNAVMLSDNISEIEENTFFSCLNLKNINMPKELKTIYSSAFFGCHSLKNVRFYDKLTRIMDDAFFENISLDSIELLNEGLRIDNLAFSSCINLKTITLSSDIKYISSNAFSDDQKVKEIRIKYPDKELVFEVNIGMRPTRNSVYKTMDIFCINLDDNAFLTVDPSGRIDKYEGQNITRLFYSGLLPKLYYISRILNKKNINDFDYNIISTIPLDNDSVKNFYQNRKEWFNLIKNNPKLENKELNILFNFCFALGLFSPKIEERNNASLFINKIIKDDHALDTLLKNEKFSLENGYSKYFAHRFMNIFDSFTSKERAINAFKSIYKYYDRICEFTTLRKIKDRTIIHSKINKMNKNVNFIEDDSYQKLVIEEQRLSKMIKNRCRDSITLDDCVYYFNNINYEFKKENEELKNISKYLRGLSRNKIEDLESFWEYAKSKNREIENSLVSIEDNSDSDIKYQMLDKFDPIGLIRGDIFNCCSTWNNPIGVNIVIESLLNEEVNSIIIKDETGEMIGSTTCYFNRKEKYLLFNNFEMSDKFIGKTAFHIKDGVREERVKALNAFIRFIQDEVNTLNNIQYQKDNTYAVTKAYVGMQRNDLSDEIENMFMPIIHTDLLKNVSFNDGYEGDANSYNYGQCIIYDEDLGIVGGKRNVNSKKI